MYDDPRTEVRRLLDKYHLDHYKVYNFASELAQMSPPAGETKSDGRTERRVLPTIKKRFVAGMVVFHTVDL